MRIATWNVNSVRSRLMRLLSVLERHAPDILCLQELKVVDEDFPALEIKQAGYESVVHGQRTYNGVALLSKEPAQKVERSLSDDTDDDQARLVAATIQDVRVLSVYVPNGGTVGSEKWEYKLTWLSRLRRYLDENLDPDQSVAICGDFNIAVDDGDVRNVEKWRSSVLCHPDGREAFRAILDWGLVDGFRQCHPDGGIYSWWDYRMLGFPKNDGLRIDGVLVTRPLAERLRHAVVDREERKGSKPSDHAPVILDFD